MNHSVTPIEFSTVLNTNSTQAADSDAVVSNQMYVSIRLIFVGFVVPAISIVGVATNMINCLVFHRQGLEDRMNLCLFSLALVDLGLLMFSFPFGVAAFFCDLSLLGVTEEHYFKTSLYSLGVAYAFRATSGCYNMVIAVERGVCVMLPLHATSLIRTKTMGAILGALAVSLQAGFLTLPFRHKIDRLEHDGKATWYLGLSEAWANNKELFEFIFSQFLGVILPVVSFLVVSIATVVTVIKLQIAMTWREKSSSSPSENLCHQTALTKTLVLVSCVYIVTMTPYVCLKLVSIFFSDFSIGGRYLMLYKAILIVVNVCPLTNSTLRFFVYYRRSSRFRCQLKALCAQNETKQKQKCLSCPSVSQRKKNIEARKP